MSSDWLAAAWVTIARANLATRMRTRDDQTRPMSTKTNEGETPEPDSSTHSAVDPVEDDSLKSPSDTAETDDAQEPGTHPHAHDNSDGDESEDAVSNASEASEDQHDSSMASESSDLAGSARGLKNFFRNAPSYINSRIKHATLKVRDSMNHAVETVKKLGISGSAKVFRDWVAQNPWKTALVVVPLVTLAWTPIILLAVEFGPGGITAGSTAAIIHAGIGNVVAGSLFETCTSAMMGGYGVPIIFGGIWLATTLSVAGCAAIWKSWHSRKDRRLMRFSTTTSKTALDAMGEAASKAIFGIMLAAAYTTYRVKSWRNGRRGPGFASGKLKRD